MGKSTCYVNIEQQSASHMVLVNYWDAKLSTVPLTPDGTVGTPTEVLMQPGAAYVTTQQPTREEHWTYRQRWPHSHCCVTEPYTEQHMFVTDLGLDKVFAYTLDAAAGCLTPQVRVVDFSRVFYVLSNESRGVHVRRRTVTEALCCCSS
jgi:6-phosphogluconolactonase (cycloisomerase 2 family)